MVDSSEHSCKFSAKRNKLALDDFYGVLDSSKEGVYTDKDFTPNDGALFWADLGEKAEDGLNPKDITWKRAFDALPGKTLFGKGMSPDDVN